VALSGEGTGAVMLGAALFGCATAPIYSVSSAHAHDFAHNDERVELSAALMFLYAVGAIAAPVIVSGLIERFGPAAMFMFVSVAHILLMVFGLTRTFKRPRHHAHPLYLCATHQFHHRPPAGLDARPLATVRALRYIVDL